MNFAELKDILEQSPVIAAVSDSQFSEALVSSAEVIFYLEANLFTLSQRIDDAHRSGKRIFIHMDLAEGLGRDRTALEYLAFAKADGIISTKAQLIRIARDLGLITIQRFFILDSKGLGSIQEMLATTKPDLIEILPGIVPKIIRRFADIDTPVIAGGLIETKAEITQALSSGAFAVSTSRQALWEL